jgi:hypothetical protein
MQVEQAAAMVSLTSDSPSACASAFASALLGRAGSSWLHSQSSS